MSEFKILDFNKKKADTIEQKRRAFNRIVFQSIGDGIQLLHDGEKWVCVGINGAVISTV